LTMHLSECLLWGISTQHSDSLHRSRTRNHREHPKGVSSKRAGQWWSCCWVAPLVGTSQVLCDL